MSLYDVTMPRFSVLVPASLALSAGEQAAKAWARLPQARRGAVHALHASALEAIEILATCTGAPRRDTVGDVLNGLNDRHF